MTVDWEQRVDFDRLSVYCPWLPPENWRDPRGAPPARPQRREARARRSRHADVPGAPASRTRARGRAAGDARGAKIKPDDELALLDHAAAIVDAVYDEIYRTLRPGITVNQVARSAARIEEEIIVTPGGPEVITRFPAEIEKEAEWQSAR